MQLPQSRGLFEQLLNNTIKQRHLYLIMQSAERRTIFFFRFHSKRPKEEQAKRPRKLQQVSLWTSLQFGFRLAHDLPAEENNLRDAYCSFGYHQMKSQHHGYRKKLPI